MKLIKSSVIAIIMMAMSAPLFAQLTLSGEFRPRTEYRHGFKSVADSAQDAAFFTDQRARFNVDYKAKGYEIKLVLQDVRTWGATSQLAATDPFTSVHEAWGNVLFNDNWSMKLGRQEIIYDDHRIFGSVGWAQQARSHDALLFKWNKNGNKLDFGFAFNQDKPQLTTTSYSVPKSYKAMQYVWFHKELNDNMKMSLLFLNNGLQVNHVDTAGVPIFHDNYTQTIGTHTKYKKDKISVAFNGYYQMGSTGTFPAMDLQAFLVGLDVGYKINDNVTATVGFELQSGNDQTDTTSSYTDVQHAFSPFYGTNHKFNGLMDYFYVGNWGSSVGLQDVFVKVKYKKEKFYVGADVHFFSAFAPVWDVYQFADDMADGNANPDYKEMDSNLGTEIDLSVGGPIADGVMLKAGFSTMLANETLAHLNGTLSPGNGTPYVDEFNSWGYVMIIIKPTFLKSDK